MTAMRNAAIALAMLAMTGPAAADSVSLYAAGSLKAALTDVATAFQTASGYKVEAKYGPSGLLRQEIAGGAGAHVFASANMEHPRSLHEAGKSGAVTMFARNRLCALVRPGLNVSSENLLTALLDPNIKVGTSTPKADPSGDYAFAVFARAEKLKPGAKAALEAKALKLTGAADSAKPPAGRVVYGWHVAEGRADIFLTYCTNAIEARQQNPDQHIVTLPENLAVGADYGLTVVNGAPDAARRFAQFILSPEGQKILSSYGFAAPAF
jgi:molybdenum ABC transporter molybdate-binding protein